MQNIISHFWRGFVLASAIVGGSLPTSAADVHVGVSSKDTYVGLPIILQIQVSDASSVEPPVFPEVDGLDIQSRGTPSQSTQITSINGRTTKSTTLTYVYEVVPTRAGNFRIPPIMIELDGTKQRTQAIEFVASKSETGNLMFVEVAGKEKQIYVGQALDLTLKIWLRPFRDTERDITLSAGDMWQMVSPRSSWGVFQDRIEQMAANREGPHGEEVLRKDSDGIAHSYYLYEIDATIYPKHSGKIDADNVHVIVEYPTALGVARDPFASMLDDMPMPGDFGSMFGDDFPSPFGRRLTVQSVRPIVADASVESIDVLSIPTTNRPADYRGAVGQYKIVTQANQTSVKAGDPIELLIGIVGTGPMELVQAPPLADLTELTADFKVPSEPLAGFVQNGRKVFSTTIRPRKEGINEIPAVPFTYFDPQKAQFVTVHSTPISIHVDPADTLALDSIVGSRSAASNRTGQGSTTSDQVTSSMQNDTDIGLLDSETSRGLNQGMLFFLLALPPALVCGIWCAFNRRSISQLLNRLLLRSHQTRDRILEAKNPAEVCYALQAHLTRRLGLSSDSNDTSATIGALRTAGQHKLAVHCERVFQAAHQTYASGVSRPASLEDVQHEALAVISELQRHFQRNQVRPRRWQGSSKNLRSAAASSGNRASRVTGLVILAVTITLAATSGASADTMRGPMVQSNSAVANSLGNHAESSGSGSVLTVEQKRVILEQASDLYDSAMNSTSHDSADAKQAYTDAAEKYQILINSGIANSRLYVNLANAYLQSGQLGKAIANYWRALDIDPANPKAQVNLEHARQLVSPADENDGEQVASNFVGLMSVANEWINRKVGLRFMGGIAITAWFAFWLAMGCECFAFGSPGKP